MYPKGFLPGQGDLHRAPKAQRSYGQMLLQDDVLFAPEGAALGSLNNTDLFLGKVQDLGELLTIIEDGLSADLDDYPSLTVRVSDARLGLQKGMFGERR